MAKHLRVDLDQVDMVSTNLHSIVQRLESAQADADQLASAIPVEELADASTDFAGKWDDRRKKLIEQVASLQKEAQTVVDAFTQVDSELADALTRPAQAAPAAGHGGLLIRRRRRGVGCPASDPFACSRSERGDDLAR